MRRRRPRRQPQRTCIACRAVRDKRQLVRVVRSVDGIIAIDPTGKESGRGAYLCRTRACWRDGIGRKCLDRALKARLSQADYALLTEFAEELPAEIADSE